MHVEIIHTDRNTHTHTSTQNPLFSSLLFSFSSLLFSLTLLFSLSFGLLEFVVTFDPVFASFLDFFHSLFILLFADGNLLVEAFPFCGSEMMKENESCDKLDKKEIRTQTTEFSFFHSLWIACILSHLTNQFLKTLNDIES